MAEGISPPEHVARTRRAQQKMESAGIEALLLTNSADILYFTGFLTRFWESPTRPWYLVVPSRGDPVAVIPSIGADLMARTWVADIRTWPAPQPEDDGLSQLSAALCERVAIGGRIGVPMGAESHLRMPIGDFFSLRRRIGRRHFVDATPLLRELQMIKSETEIELIADVCAIAGRAFEAVPDFAKPGVPLSHIFRDFQIALLSEGADWVSYLAGGAGAGGYRDVISPASSTPVATGNVLMLDTGAVRAGYFCDFDRNWAIGRAEPEARDAHKILYEATEAGFAAAKPGATTADVFAAMARVITTRGSIGSGGRLGHGLGMRLTEAPSITADDTTVLVQGMVLTLEPGLELSAGRGMVHEEVVVIGSTGPEWLSPRGPSELPVID